MMALPVATAVTTPVAETVPMAVLLDRQMPPEVVLVNGVLLPKQTDGAPEIEDGGVSTLIVTI